jgi:hypothetical protein
MQEPSFKKPPITKFEGPKGRLVGWFLVFIWFLVSWFLEFIKNLKMLVGKW